MSAGFELLDTHESKAQRDGHIRIEYGGLRVLDLAALRTSQFSNADGRGAPLPSTGRPAAAR